MKLITSKIVPTGSEREEMEECTFGSALLHETFVLYCRFALHFAALHDPLDCPIELRTILEWIETYIRSINREDLPDVESQPSKKARRTRTQRKTKTATQSSNNSSFDVELFQKLLQTATIFASECVACGFLIDDDHLLKKVLDLIQHSETHKGKRRMNCKLERKEKQNKFEP
jgi:hypothetical protein